ncbi:MAG: diphosphate--fructose-6-phosphate 1-phosphotransferase, partial [Spirochaetes bacterium]|nr:diphosphate--fructose-6-phosphate 1-phosphotransferase [Spirochaetota bacterium]
NYCYSLGYTSFLLISAGLSGYMASVKNLFNPIVEWKAGGLPITMMMNMEQRHGKLMPVIKKALVELDGKPFNIFKSKREKWNIQTSYLYPGAIQYFGPDDVCNKPTKTLIFEHN